MFLDLGTETSRILLTEVWCPTYQSLVSYLPESGVLLTGVWCPIDRSLVSYLPESAVLLSLLSY